MLSSGFSECCSVASGTRTSLSKSTSLYRFQSRTLKFYNGPDEEAVSVEVGEPLRVRTHSNRRSVLW